MNIKKLTIREKIGYGFASTGDSLAYTMVGSFLLFFLTTVADIEPAIGGTILAIGAIWNAFINPIIGFFSDKVRSKYGKRRPMIFIFSIPLGISIFLIFTNIPINSSIKALYYGILLMILWLSYTGFFVPYLALGAEYTRDYDDRTKLRLMASLFNCIGSAISMTFPSGLVSYLEGYGISKDSAWSILGLIIGVITTFSIVVTVIASKSKDLPCDEHIDFHFSIRDIFMEYIGVALLKPMKYLIAASTLSLISYTIVMSDMVYFLTYNMNASPAIISLSLLGRTITGILMIPICGKIAMIIDKKYTMILFYIIAMVGMIYLRLTYVDFSWRLVMYVLVSSICTTIYWHFMPSIYYDICDYDLYINGKNRQGTIVSFQGLIEAIATGLGALILGIILQSSGFNGEIEIQSDYTKEWIFNCATIIPIIFLIFSCIALYNYPITREIYKEIVGKSNQSNG